MKKGEIPRLSLILYYIGGTIVFLGIAILVGQHWSKLNSVTKILLSLGSGIAAFITGILLDREAHLTQLSQAFYFISGLILPVGLLITFDSAKLDVYKSEIQSLISGILLVTYLGSYRIFPKIIFLIFSIIFGTWLYLSFIGLLISGSPLFADWRFQAYRVLVIYSSYLLLGYHFSRTPGPHSARHTLAQWLLGIGVFGFLGTALALGGWSPNQSVAWELVFPGLALGIIFLSIALKNESFLVFGSFYLMAYIAKISAEYFKDSLGWPLSLVLIGFLLMGVGYFAFYLNKRYMR